MHDRRKGVFAEAWTIGKAVAQAMRITFVNFFRKPVTVHYPTVARQFPNRFRGLLALTYDKETGEENCIGCRLCEFICPPAVIKVEMLKGEKRNYAKFFSLELYACEFCELCVQPRDQHEHPYRLSLRPRESDSYRVKPCCPSPRGTCTCCRA